ncbi:ABC transporter permease [Saccharopolyspora phatthalungensis]|uniref:ABC-2 type transport system permease protein n=1 Tax=Saccharopolyspora phatthalungensis TaxID=664693 RepID=A0A840Q5J5_9PSEU|nr:ABC transporter permease subunit [Saccharopolyspora phatthalungensis]MBB5155227.1 ABC-2 type transport system permease protein [Saccharopolyspora phatthalungensis]
MGGLVKAEFRKIFTTSLWWALLIPVALLGFGAGWLGTAIVALIDMVQQYDRSLPLGLLSVSMSTNFSTIFAALFGAMAFAGEYRNKSITTTYLTGNPRGAVLVAKLIACSGIGLIYGLANVLFASLGGLLGAGQDFGDFGSLADWLSVGAAGVFAMVLWTLLGVGFGALVANAVLAIIVPLVYKFVVEFILSLSLIESPAAGVGAYLPGAAGNGIVSNLAVPLFVAAVAGPDEPNTPRVAFEFLHLFFGGSYGHPWWASLLTFVGYTAVFVAGGWLVSRRRDIT